MGNRRDEIRDFLRDLCQPFAFAHLRQFTPKNAVVCLVHSLALVSSGMGFCRPGMNH